MLIRVLGSAAGGGFPQWNCACRNCADVRRSVAGLKARSQSSLAVSADGKNWCLLNASPDLREQLAAFERLSPHPGEGLRNSPLKAVVLTNADVDHIAGLLNLREGQPFSLYASDRVLSAINANPVFSVMREGLVQRKTVRNHESFEPAGCPGLQIEMFIVPGKVALYLENPQAGENFVSDEGDVVGLKLTDTSTSRFVIYIPGCAAVDDSVKQSIEGAAALFLMALSMKMTK